MSKKFLVPIDLNKLEIQNVALQNLATAPASPVAGQVYFNTTDDKAYCWDGTTWIPWEVGASVTPATATPLMDGTAAVGTSLKYAREDHVHPSDTSRVSTTTTVNGHALSSNVTVTASDVGISAGTQAILEAGTDTAERSWQAKILYDYISSAIGAANAMRFKGTIGTGGDISVLPTTGVQVGDTYMVVTAGTYAGQTCEVGDLIIATATTPTWTVAQTNIDGAITTITGTSPVSVTGSGNSRNVSVSYTSVTGKPTANQTPSFGGTFTISQISQSTTGQISATDRAVTIPDSVATTSTAGLMSATDKLRLGSTPKADTTLVIQAGNTSVTFTDVLVSSIRAYMAYDATTGEDLVLDLKPDGNGDAKFSIASAYTHDININVVYWYSGI